MPHWLTLTNPGGLDERSRVPSNLVLEAENLGLAHDGWLVMRPGLGSESLTGASLTGPIQWGTRFINSSGVEEIWLAAENSGGVAAMVRRVSGTWSSVTISDTITVADLRYITSASLNGKLFLAYNSDVNRLHVWDGTSLRRVGLALPAAPTVATLGGAGITDTHYYRVRWLQLSGSTVIRRSEPSASANLAIVDDSGWRITRPTAASEGETHWEVEAAEADAGPWYRLAQVAIATTTYDHSSDAVDTTNLSDIAGLHVPPPSAKYLLSTGTRLLMAGAWEASAASGQTEPETNRIWFTRVLNSSGEGDDETIPDTVNQTNWIDIGDASPLTGLGGPLVGDVYHFKADQFGRLVPTSDDLVPYSDVPISPFTGAVDQRVIINGLSHGAPAIYFASVNSAQRITGGGLTDISDEIARDLRTSNITAGESVLGFDPAMHQLVLVINTSAPARSGSYFQFSYDSVQDRWSGWNQGGSESGWIIGTGVLGVSTVIGDAGSFIRTMFSGQASDGITRLLAGGQDTNEAAALGSWGTTIGTDTGSAYTSRVRWRGIVHDEGHRVSVGAPTVVYRDPSASQSANATITVAYVREDGETVTESRAAVDGLTAQTVHDPLSIRTMAFEGLQLADIDVLDVRVSMTYDAGFYSAVLPGVDCIRIPYTVQESLTV